MDAHTALDEWETSPFDGGLEEAARLADRGFSGAIRSGSDWLFIADGDPVAVVADLKGEPSVGDVDAFEGADGDALEAPHPGVARLVPMLALGGEVRGEYFSDDTPVGTVQETLEDGDFTGYVALSENVLSGDYYVVFEDGRPEYVAFIGSTEQLVTGEEAESKTKNEVGIYSVVAVDLPDVELPEPPSDTGPVGGVAADDGDGAAGGTGAVGGAGAGTAAGAGAATGGDTDAGGEADASGEPATGSDADEGPRDSESDSAPVDATEAESGGGGSTSADDSATEDPVAEPVGPDTADDGADGVDTDDASGAADSASDIGVGAPDAEPVEAAPSAEDDAPSDQGVPSVDPDVSGRARDVEGTATGATAGTSSEPTDDLRNELRELRSTVDRLETRVASLEAEGDGGGGTATAGRTDGPSLSPEEALSQTTLFVREGTRGGPTLDDAHDGRADRDALARNLDLEWHTRFDEAGATVDGQPYGAFLESSQAYEFVEWLTMDLLFEIRVTDSVGGLSKLYDAIPEADRVFFHESVSVDDGTDTVEMTFDVVVRDRNGAPLFVASLDDHRDPTPSNRIERLVTDASDFCAADASVVGAFAVTASYFDPEALEVAQEATTSSLLSRQKQRSYVNLTRKNGFHLCLVEARDAAFHLTLPEL